MQKQNSIFLNLSLIFIPLIIISTFAIDRDLSNFFYINRDHVFMGFLEFITFFGKSEIYILFSLIFYLTFRKKNLTLAKLSLFIFYVSFLSGAIATIIKFIFAKTRPLLYHQEGIFSFKWFEYGHEVNSFPSGHSSTALSVFLALALVFPKHKFSFLGLGILIAISRLGLDIHYLSDVLFGSFIGILVALFLFKKFDFNELKAVSLSPYIFLIIMILFSFISPLSYFPLFDLDEGAFSEATREMIVNKDYITTYLNGELRFDKPILFYWTQLISIKIYGLYEFGARFSSAFFASLWVIATFFFVKKFFNLYSAFWSAFLFLTTLQISVIAKAAIADSLLNFTIAISMFSIYIYYIKKEQKYLYITFIFISLGTLTKGPIAILIPFFVSFIFFLINKELKIFFKALFNMKAILLFLLIVTPWYLAEYLIHKQAFIDGFFLKHNINRFNLSMESHSGPFYYYFIVIILGMLPFFTLLANVFLDIKEKLKDKLTLFLLIWFIFVFLFFSFSSTKLPHYIIYGYTPLIIFMAISIKRVKNEYLLFLPLFLFLSFFIIFPDLLIFFQDKIKDEYILVLISHIKEEFNLVYKSILFISLIALFVLKIAKINLKYKIIAIGIIFVFNVNFVITKAYANLVQQPIKDCGIIADINNYNLTMWKINTPTLLYKARKLVKRTKPINGDIVVTKINDSKEFRQIDIIYQKYGIIMFKVIQE